jgi:hypothetical protein
VNDCVVVEGMKDALAVAVNGDNSGPQSADGTLLPCQPSNLY